MNLNDLTPQERVDRLVEKFGMDETEAWNLIDQNITGDDD